MKRTTQSPVSIGAEEIITSNLYIDGVEIGTAMLPKLVHRTSLSPIVVDGEVEQRQFYTLHNDAGDCVFVSPALQERMNKKWTRPWRWNWRNSESWHLHPIIVPEGSTYGAIIPDGWTNLPDGTITHDKLIVDDISWWYATNPRKTVIPPAYAGYKAKNILKANHTWEKSGLTSYKMDLPNCISGTRMFAQSYNLVEFKAKDFKSLQHAEGMFEECEYLEKLPSNNDVFDGVMYGAKMFMKTKLSSFGLEMPNLVNGTSMFNYCTSLASCSTPSFPELIEGSAMFYYCDGLKTISTTFPKLQVADSMYRGCTLLGGFTASDDAMSSGTYAFPALINGRNMFRDCVNLNCSNLNDSSFPVLEDGMAMFQGTPITSIPCKFPALQNARQMFYKTPISGHLELDMPRDFPNVSVNGHNGGDYPTAYMFGSCPITSLSFDVSSCDHGVSMFNSCTSITTCTKAVFKSGGNYQNMLSECRFDAASAEIIMAAAAAAGVQVVHIGVQSQYRTEEFKNKHGLIQLNEGSDSQWKQPSSNVIIVWN